jgi:fructose-1,6-bisphosphatase/sedoheptulose 1,7-bisphosphatase-like protein
MGNLLAGHSGLLHEEAGLPSCGSPRVDSGSEPSDAPIEDVIDVTARILGKQLRDVVVCVTDRPRNQDIIEAVCRKGATLRMIMDGDISAAMAPAMHTSTIDLYAGIGGAGDNTVGSRLALPRWWYACQNLATR